MRKGQTSHKNEHNTLMCFPLEPVFTRDGESVPNFMDEPTSGLDVIARDEILDWLRSYMETEGRSILISSHISGDLEGFCDDIYMLDRGTIVLHEESDHLLEEYALLKVTEEQYQTLDKTYLLRVKKEEFGYQCLTNEKQFYMENYPQIVVENGSIDTLLYMMIRGENV